MIDLDSAKEKVLDKPEIKKVTQDLAIPAEWNQEKYQPDFVKATVQEKCNIIHKHSRKMYNLLWNVLQQGTKKKVPRVDHLCSLEERTTTGLLEREEIL